MFNLPGIAPHDSSRLWYCKTRDKYEQVRIVRDPNQRDKVFEKTVLEIEEEEYNSKV